MKDLTNEGKESTHIKQALEGNESAYKKLYELHVDGLFIFLNQFSKNREQTKDWVQKSFIKAFENLSGFQERSTFKTWLFTIGLNVMRTEQRKITSIIEFNSDFVDQVRSQSEFSEDQDFDPELWESAKEAIKELDPDKKLVVLLHIAEGYQHSEISTMLNISESASRVILHRAKNELRNKVAS